MAECTENALEICRFRGDTTPIKRRVTQSGSPSVIDITGFNYLLTVNTSKNPDLNASPVVGAQQFQIVGTLTTPANGQFEFRFDGSPNPALLDPGTYYYDIQQTDGSGNVRTIAKGKYIVKQDITK
jgi:hypothetical protein